MKKVSLLAGFLILSLFSFSEDRTAYILVPSSIDLKEVKVTGIVNGDEETHVVKDLIGVDEDIPTRDDLGDDEVGVVVQSSNIGSYGDTKYIEVVIANVEKTDEVKFVMGYPVDGKSIPTYAVIASQDIKTATVNGKTLEEIFQDETRTLDELLDAEDFTYSDFPGRELQRDTRISGIVVGNEVMDDATLPSNIVDMYSKSGGELDDTINKVSGGADINPNNSDTNSEFELWAVKTDADGNIIPKTDPVTGEIIYKKNQDETYALDEDGNKIPDSERVLLYTSKDSGENPIYGDLRSVVPEKSNGKYKDGEIPIAEGSSLYTGDPSNGDPYSYYVYDIDVRFKGSGTININNEPVSIGLGDKKWQFYNVEDVTLTFNGGNSFYFGLTGDEVGINPPDGSNPEDIPLPVAEEFYAIEDTGEDRETETDLISQYQGVQKSRQSNIMMKVITGAGEQNYEVENIRE